MDATIDDTIDHPQDWAFVKLVPGAVAQVHLVDFQSLDRIAEADALLREAVRAISCPTHGTVCGAILTWRGVRQVEVRMDPLPCCQEFDDLGLEATGKVMEELWPKWQAQEAQRFQAMMARPLAALLASASSRGSHVGSSA
ncbi:MAG: hypothetical protein ACRENE_17200 [Polyangiaceae bacterium]